MVRRALVSVRDILTEARCRTHPTSSRRLLYGTSLLRLQRGTVPRGTRYWIVFCFLKKKNGLTDKYLPKVLLGLRLHLLGTGLLT